MMTVDLLGTKNSCAPVITCCHKRKIVDEIIETFRGDGFQFLDVKRCDSQVVGLQKMDSTSTHMKVVKALLGRK